MLVRSKYFCSSSILQKHLPFWRNSPGFTKPTFQHLKSYMNTSSLESGKDTGKSFNCTLLLGTVINCSQPRKNLFQENVHGFQGGHFAHYTYTASSHVPHCSGGVLKAHTKVRQVLDQLQREITAVLKHTECQPWVFYFAKYCNLHKLKKELYHNHKQGIRCL